GAQLARRDARRPPQRRPQGRVATDVNYGRREPFTLGVEEELQLLHPESYELASRYEEVFGEAEAADNRIRPELMQSTVEVATQPVRTVAEALDEACELRRRLRDEAVARDCLIAASGTHPFSRWQHQEITDK